MKDPNIYVESVTMALPVKWTSYYTISQYTKDPNVNVASVTEALLVKGPSNYIK